MKWWATGLLLFLLNSSVVKAVTLTISDYPSQITDQPFTVNVTVSGAQAATNYLRADLFKEGSTNYFGETNNGSSWYSGSEAQQYLPIVIASAGSASAQLTARLGNPTAGEYPGPGGYKLRIRRYTSSGNTSSSDIQAPVDIQIAFAAAQPTPTPTPTPKSTPVSSPKPTPTPVSSPKNSPTATPAAYPSPAASSDLVVQIGEEERISESFASPSPDETNTSGSDPRVLGSSTTKPNIGAIAVIVFGIGLFAASGFIIWRHHKGIDTIDK